MVKGAYKEMAGILQQQQQQQQQQQKQAQQEMALKYQQNEATLLKLKMQQKEEQQQQPPKSPQSPKSMSMHKISMFMHNIYICSYILALSFSHVCLCVYYTYNII